MKLTADMFVGAVVTAGLLFGSLALQRRIRRKADGTQTRLRAMERDVYEVSWWMFAIGFGQFALAALPIAVLVLSPNPGVAGYLVFGAMSVGWAGFGVWFIRKLFRTSVVFDDARVIYRDGGREHVLAFAELSAVGTSFGYIVCDKRSGGRRFTIPMEFAGSAMILARLQSVWERRANQPPQRNAGSRPFPGDLPVSEPPSALGPRG